MRGLDDGRGGVYMVRTMMRFLARVVALLCAVLFVPVAVGTLFFQAAGTRLVQAATYKETLDREGFYAKAPGVFAETISRAMEVGLASATSDDTSEGALAFLHQLSREDLESLIAAAMPPAALREQTEAAIDEFFRYLHEPEAEPSIPLSLAEFKRRVAGAELESAYVSMLQRKPAFDGAMPEVLLPVAYCPTEAQWPGVRERFRHAMGLAVAGLPDSVDVLGRTVSADRSGNLQAALDHVRGKVREYEWIARWSPVVPALLLLLVVLAGVRSVRGFLLWCGFPCLIAGAVAAVLALPSASITYWLCVTLVGPQLPPQIPALILDTALGLLTSAMEVVLGVVLVHASWLGLGGLIAVLLAFLFKSKP
ncbi:MAG TPA: hypothetical protein PKK58_07235, partial [Opitutaceae bacterium]|nr:hypothetical protein [Opitutaceae bacterium]